MTMCNALFFQGQHNNPDFLNARKAVNFDTYRTHSKG